MKDFTTMLCGMLKDFDDVIIYGYMDIGVTVLDCIIDLETDIRIGNYSGRVKYFATSDRVRDSARTEIKGIKIKSIYDLTTYSKKALVIVATKEKHHNTIQNLLDELGFKNILFVLHEHYCEIREIVENHRGIVNTQIGQYQLNHSIKLDRLRRRISEGKKVKVFFVTHDSAVFGAASVYRQMESDSLFEPYIYVVSRRDVTYRDFYRDVKADVSFFESRGYRVICGYDENENLRDLHEFAPDIVFYDIPKLYGAGRGFCYRLDRINWEYLTCYIPYGILMVDSFYYHYHIRCIRETWKFFVDTNASYKRVMADGDFSGFNMILSGYPKFDDFRERKDYKLPQKIDNGNPTVIYAPHHSLGVSNNFATFDLYGEKIYNLAKDNSNINFVFKPHPLLRFQVKTRFKEGLTKVSPEDYKDYLRRWQELPNAVIVEGGDYIELFKRSACMITDCGSFIGEYLPSGHPCIYIFNPRKKNQEDVYTPLAQRILDSYYITKTEEELDAAINEVVLRRIDVKKEKRELLLKSEFSSIGNAGERICKYLRDELTR